MMTDPPDMPASPPPEIDPNWREKLAASLAELPAKREELVRELEALLPIFNTFDLLSWVSLRNLLIDPENYREGENGGMALRVEYLTLVGLINGFQDGRELAPGSDEYDRLNKLIDDICTSEFFEPLQRRLAQGAAGADSTLSRLADGAHMNEMFVRVPGHPHHHEQVLRGVFLPLDGELRSSLGFGPEDAIKLSVGLKTRLQRGFDTRMTTAKQAYVHLEKLARQRRKGVVEGLPDGLTDEILVTWSRLGDGELRTATRAMARATAMTIMGDILAFTPADLATEAGVTAEIAQRFLEAFTLEFGSVDRKYRHPEALHPLKQKPIIRHEGRYLAPIPDQILWALQPLFERTLLEGRSSQRFVMHRHDWLLDEGCRLLRRIMPALVIDKNLKFPKPGGLRGDVAELDALGRYDSALFLIEAKGASLRDKGKVGSPLVFRDEMEKILEAAHEQALRAQKHVGLGGTLLRQDGEELVPDLAGVTRVFLVGITLEPLGFLTARMDADNPFSASPDHALFAVGIHDLMAMADCLEGYPPWFPHYLLRRMRIAKQGFLSSAEELDLFCYYMERGLYHKGPEDFGEATHVTIGTWTDELDEYYFYCEGKRKKSAQCPHPMASADLLRYIERLESSSLRGRLDAMLAVIDLGEESRKDFFLWRTRARSLGKDDGRAHDFSMIGTGTWGLTYATGAPSQLQALNLSRYLERKRKETAVPYWVAVTESAARDPRFLEVLVSGEPKKDIYT